MSNRNRIDKVTTRRGDSGETSLADGKPYAKSSPRLDLIGEVDELNCFVGFIQPHLNAVTKQRMIEIQSRLFDLGAALATGQPQAFWSEQIRCLEDWTEQLNSQLEPLKEFVLPGNSEVNARIHLARAVCRRAERAFWRLNDPASVKAHMGGYLNRLSDFLFVLARTESDEEILWQPLED